MALNCSGHLFQIIGDGEKTAIIMPGEGAYILEDSYAKSISVSIPSLLEGSSINGYREFVPYHRYTEITLDIAAGKTTFSPSAVDLIGKDFFQKMTVLELFKIINQKLNKR